MLPIQYLQAQEEQKQEKDSIQQTDELKSLHQKEDQLQDTFRKAGCLGNDQYTRVQKIFYPSWIQECENIRNGIDTLRTQIKKVDTKWAVNSYMENRAASRVLTLNMLSQGMLSIGAHDKHFKEMEKKYLQTQLPSLRESHYQWLTTTPEGKDEFVNMTNERLGPVPAYFLRHHLDKQQ